MKNMQNYAMQTQIVLFCILKIEAVYEDVKSDVKYGFENSNHKLLYQIINHYLQK